MNTNLDRRNFIKVSMIGGSFVAALPLFGCEKTITSSSQELTAEHSKGVKLGWFVRISPDNSIVIGAPTMEMGQGVFTSMPMMIAEELDADWARVIVELMPLALRKVEEGDNKVSDGAYNGYDYAHAYQGAGGSQSVNRNYTYLREAGAMIRSRLMRAAALRWGVSVSELRTENSFVSHKTDGRSASYGDIIAAAALLDDDVRVDLKNPKDFKIIGVGKKIKGSREIVTGAPIFGIDQEMPGMVHAILERSPYMRGTPLRFDDSAVRAVPGVIDVIQIDRKWPVRGGPSSEVYLHGAVAVVAETLWAAMKARKLLNIEWDKGQHANESTEGNEENYRQYLYGDGSEGATVKDDGDVERALENSALIVEAEYTFKTLTHVCMEPHSAVADMRPGVWKVAASHQFPERIAHCIAEITGCDALEATVETARMGGGFGRKFPPDYISEAVWLSHKLQRPVKVTWTREDDIRNDAFNPPGMSGFKAGVDDSGNIVAWDHKIAAHGFHIHVFPAGMITNFRARRYRPETGMWFGAWRGPGHNTMGFMVQSFIDEVAHATKKDPLLARLDLLEPGQRRPYPNWGAEYYDSGREAAVLRLAALQADWQARDNLPKGVGRGIASHFTFGSYCAHVIDVKVEDGELEILRVVSAVDCGQPVNRLGIEAQVEGGLIDGLSVALHQAIHLKDGQVVETNFDSYRLMRINEAPKQIDVHIIDSAEHPTGTGEISLPPAIPALTNAIFAATGKRIRSLPIADQLKV